MKLVVASLILGIIVLAVGVAALGTYRKKTGRIHTRQRREASADVTCSEACMAAFSNYVELFSKKVLSALIYEVADDAGVKFSRREALFAKYGLERCIPAFRAQDVLSEQGFSSEEIAFAEKNWIAQNGNAVQAVSQSAVITRVLVERFRPKAVEIVAQEVS